MDAVQVSHWAIWSLSLLLNLGAWLKTPQVWKGLGDTKNGSSMIATPAEYVSALGHILFGALSSFFFLVACCPPVLQVWKNPRTASCATVVASAALGLSMVSMFVWFGLISGQVSGYSLIVIFVVTAIPMLGWFAIQIHFACVLRRLAPKDNDKTIDFDTPTYCKALRGSMLSICDAVKNLHTQDFGTVCSILIRLNASTYYTILLPVWIWVVVTGFGVTPGIDPDHKNLVGNIILGLFGASSFEDLATSVPLYGIVQGSAIFVGPIPIFLSCMGATSLF